MPPVLNADGRFGLCDVLPGRVAGATEAWARLAYDAGARINRWEFRWDRIEPSPGSWSFTPDDAAVADSQAAGLDVLGILIGTPAWADGTGQKPGNGVPAGLDRPVTDPGNLWAVYVRHMVTHYAGRVKYWEVWNEPDLPFFWSGSPQQYARLLAVAYEVITAIDPGAQVLIGGMVVPDLRFFVGALRSLHSTQNPPYDGVAWHQYGPARDAYTNLQHVRAAVQSAGLPATRLWVTEDGFPASNPQGEVRQAAYIEQTAAYAFAAGAYRVLVYRLADDTEPKAWGLMTASGAPRLAYRAFQVAASTFSGARRVVYAPQGALERFAVYGSSGRTLVLWNRSVQPATTDIQGSVSAPASTDWLGNPVAAASTPGAAAMAVPPADYNRGIDEQGLVVGGPPVIVRLADAPAPPAAPAQLVSVPSGNARRLLVVNDGATPAMIRVSDVQIPLLHADFRVPGRGVEPLDLDLIAGSSYAGDFVLTASPHVVAAGIAGSVLSSPQQLSRTWFATGSLTTVRVTNPSPVTAALELTQYDAMGADRVHEKTSLAPRTGATIALSPGAARSSLVIKASKAIGVAPGSAQVGAQREPSQQWYWIARPRHRLTLFNPDASLPVDVTVRSSASTLTQRVSVPPRELRRVRVAGGVSVVAAAPVIAASEAGETQPVDALFTHTVLLASSGSVRLFNPGGEVARIAVTAVDGTSANRTLTVPPDAVKRVRVAAAPNHVLALDVRADLPVDVTSSG